MKNISRETRLALFRTMLLIRRFEEKIIEVYPEQEMKSPVHLCIGQEAVAAGVCAHLKATDYLMTNHRSHGHCLAKGASAYALYAEFYGRATGCSKGRGGSMHPALPELGVMGTSAIVGGGIPIATGTALASKMQGLDRVSVVFFGDGATEEGAFTESLSFAALKRLPIVFVCENNAYATNSHITARQPNDLIYKRAEPFGIPSKRIDGNDVLAVYSAAEEAVARARSGEGPTLIECVTYRWKGHVGPDCDHERGCRPMSQIEAWKQKCPLVLARAAMWQEGTMSEAEEAEMLVEIDRGLDDALARAKAAPLPEPAELTRYVYYTEGR